MSNRMSDDGDLLRLGATVSAIQSVLFVVIGLSAVALDVGQLVEDGFAALAGSDLALFRLLCSSFVAIAALGIAITPAERAAVAPAHRGWALFGANLAYLGHAGTIAYFSWWLVATRSGVAPTDADEFAPLQWGAGFELVMVGAWVWIIAGLIRRDRRWPRPFLWLSIAKATTFWLAFASLFTTSTAAITGAVGVVTLVTGPLWHGWIATLLRRIASEEQS